MSEQDDGVGVAVWLVLASAAVSAALWMIELLVLAVPVAATAFIAKHLLTRSGKIFGVVGILAAVLLDVAMIGLDVPAALVLPCLGYLVFGYAFDWVKYTKTQKLSQHRKPAPADDLRGNDAPHDPAYDFDPSRFAGGASGAGASHARTQSTSRDIVPTAGEDEDDDTLLKMALDPRTPEGERQAAMRQIAKRKRGRSM